MQAWGSAADAGAVFRLDVRQREACAAIVACRQPVLVTGGPGSGKTEVLVRAVAGLVARGVGFDRIVVLTHTRPAAQRLRRRIMAQLAGAFFEPRVTTIHGWCARLLGRAGATSAPRLLTAPEQEFRVRELLEERGPDPWPADLRPATGTRAFAAQLRHLLTRARQAGLDPADLIRLGRLEGRPAWVAAGTFFEAYLDVLDAEQVLDYAELVHRTRLLLAQAGPAAALRADVSVVLVDELAEVDAAGWGLLRDAWAAGVPVGGFADATTSVFGFRGALLRPEAAFQDGFAPPGAPAACFDLPHDYRSAPAIAAAVASLGARLRRPAAPSPEEAPPDPGGAGPRAGRIDVWVCPSAQVRDAALAVRLRQRHTDDGVPWDQMVVLGQSEGDSLRQVALGLAGSGIPARVDAGRTGLAEEPAVREFLPVLDLVAAWAAGETAAPTLVAAALSTRLAGLDAAAVRQAARAVQSRGTVWAAAGQAVSGIEVVAREFSEPHDLAETPSPGEVAPLHCLRELHRTWRAAAERLRGDGDVSQLLWDLWSAGDWPERARAEACSPGVAGPQANADLDAVMALFDLAGAHPAWRGVTGLRQFRALLDQYVIGADTARESDAGQSFVRVMSVRQAKGRGWDTVVVTGAAEGRWPSSPAAPDMLDGDALGTAPDGPDRSARRREQQRAFLLACSRAERALIVVADAEDDATPVRVSRFVRYLGVEPTVVAGTEGHVTLGALVADLRRATLDGAAPPALRETAAELLGVLSRERDIDGHRLSRAAGPSTWWGVRDADPDHPAREPGPQVIQSSHLGDLLRCPRQWFLSRRAQAGPPSGASAQVGTLLHEVFRRDADGGLGAEGAAAVMDARWSGLGFDAPWKSAWMRAEASQAYDRFALWRDERPDRTCAGVEVPFRWRTVLDGRPVEVTGTIDRLERDDAGRWIVVDFKTGPQPKVADHRDQLALYELALGEGVFEAGPLAGEPPPRPSGPPELVYARVPAGAGDAARCKVIRAPTLAEHPHDAAIEFDDPAYPTWAHARLARAAALLRAGQFEARPGSACRACAFRQDCPARTRPTVPAQAGREA
ncbi:MAG: ATP-dependent helicase [Actinomycetia bacterium]|nr:ATP-dependent helicase [Actinomycetes bacterium]